MSLRAFTALDSESLTEGIRRLQPSAGNDTAFYVIVFVVLLVSCVCPTVIIARSSCEQRAIERERAMEKNHASKQVKSDASRGGTVETTEESTDEGSNDFNAFVLPVEEITARQVSRDSIKFIGERLEV